MAHTNTTWVDTPYTASQKNSNENLIVRLVASIMLALMLITSLGGLSTPAAHAADDGDKKVIEKLEEAKKGLGVTASGDEGFQQILDKTRQNGSKSSFASVINRVVVPGYIYNHPKSSTDGYYQGNKKWSCDANDPNKGLLTYHNCDVPNFAADLGQNLFSAITPTGIQRGNAESSKLDLPWLGLPTGVKTVPATASARVEKFTALELFGYNLRLTYYAGEFDHIQVQTEARLMSNFGASQTLALGVNAMFNGLSDGAGSAFNAFTSELSKGNIMGAVSSAFTAGTESSIASAVETILDTSDANIMATRGYTRIGIDKTLYNARSATNAEMEQEIINTIASAIAGKTPEEVRLPDDLKKLQTPPAQPSSGGTTCVVSNPDGTLNTISKLKDEAACAEAAKTANMEAPNYKWDGEDKPAESLKDWKEHNKEWFEAANKYGLTCNVDEDEGKRSETLSAFYSCVPTAYEAAAKKYAKEKEGEAGKKLAEFVNSPGFFQDFLKKNIAANFNSPTNQYYCQNPDGTDKLDSNGKPMKLFTANGQYNPDCQATRSPVKGGIYGTGDGVMTDTRRLLYDPSLGNVVFNNASTFTDFANAGIMSASAITRFGNAALNLGMSPLMQTFGVDNLVAELVELFTKSAFYPFAVTFGLAGILLIVLRAIRGGLFPTAKELAMFILTVIVVGGAAVGLLSKPHETIRAVDRATNIVDSVIAEALVTGVIGDEICSSTGSMSTFKYNTTRTDSDPATRTLMCEVWRMNTLTPWSYAQWGTGYSNLYAVDAKRPSTANTLINTNSSQVGRAPVQMGSGVTVNNWALYQLQLQSTGTTTEDNPNQPGGVTNRNMYKIVDVQAGPDNGAGTDSRYLKYWAGRDGVSRATTGALAPVAALATSFTVGYYAIIKAIIKVILLFMILLLPFVLLMALLGKQAKGGTKKYLMTILGLYIQSALLTFMLCLLSLILISLTSAVDAYIYVFVVQTIASIILLLGTRKIMKKVMRGSGVAGTVSMTDTQNILSKNATGRRILTTAKRAPNELKHGLARGYVENGWRGAIKEGVKAFDIRNTPHPANRTGWKRTLTTAHTTGLETARRKATKDETVYNSVKSIADNLQNITTAEQGVDPVAENSISRLKSAKDIRRANKAVKGYKKAQASERKQAEEAVEKQYAQRAEYAELMGNEWTRPDGEEHEANVLNALAERSRSVEAVQAILQENIENQANKKRLPRSERTDIQNDERFTAEEKAVHKAIRNENRVRNTAKSMYRAASQNITDRFRNQEAVDKVKEAVKGDDAEEMPIEIEQALMMAESELHRIPLSELGMMRDWLKAHPGTSDRDEKAVLLTNIERVIRYRMDR